MSFHSARFDDTHGRVWSHSLQQGVHSCALIGTKSKGVHGFAVIWTKQNSKAFPAFKFGRGKQTKWRRSVSKTQPSAVRDALWERKNSLGTFSPKENQAVDTLNKWVAFPGKENAHHKNRWPQLWQRISTQKSTYSERSLHKVTSLFTHWTYGSSPPLQNDATVMTGASDFRTYHTGSECFWTTLITLPVILLGALHKSLSKSCKVNT